MEQKIIIKKSVDAMLLNLVLEMFRDEQYDETLKKLQKDTGIKVIKHFYRYLYLGVGLHVVLLHIPTYDLYGNNLYYIYIVFQGADELCGGIPKLIHIKTSEFSFRFRLQYTNNCRGMHTHDLIYFIELHVKRSPEEMEDIAKTVFEQIIQQV